jgi:voltage-gated sodium channel
MGYVALLLLLLFYIYAVIGTSLFARNDPLNFGTLNASMLSLFQVVTLEGWAEIFRIQYFGSANFGYEGKEHLIVQSAAMPTAAVLYFVTFILIGTMVMLNLLIGVIMNGMQEAQQESDRADREKHEKKFGQTTSLDELELLEQKLTEVHHQISVVRSRLCKTARQPGKPSEIARQ